MNTSAIVTFAIIASFVWGGVAWIVITAFRKERAKAVRTAAPAAAERAPGS